MSRGAASWRAIGRALLLGAVLAAGGLGWRSAAALGIDPAYAPLVVAGKRVGDGLEFDLGPAQQRARREGKRLYLYLGAHDCSFCRRYEAFLAAHVGELREHFAGYLVVDLRSALAVDAHRLRLRVGPRSVDYPAFQRAIGDQRTRMLVYPTVWLLDAELKPLMQMPSGAGTFETVPEQIEILNLVQ